MSQGSSVQNFTCQANPSAIGSAVGSAINSQISALAGKIERLQQSVERTNGHIQAVTSAVNTKGDALIGKVGQLEGVVLSQLIAELAAINQLEKEVRRSIQANVQGQLSQFIGDLEGLKKAVQLALVQIAEIFGKSIVRQQRIFDKYNKMEEEVLLSFERDHKRLGEPIYKFLEEQYLPSIGEYDGFIHNTLRFFSEESTRHAKRRGELDEKPRRSLAQAKEAFLKTLSSITENTGGKGTKLTMDDALIEMECLVSESRAGQILMATSEKQKTDSKTQTGPELILESLSANLSFKWKNATTEELKDLIRAIGSLKSRGFIPVDVADLLSFSVEAHGVRLAEPLKS